MLLAVVPAHELSEGSPTKSGKNKTPACPKLDRTAEQEQPHSKEEEQPNPYPCSTLPIHLTPTATRQATRFREVQPWEVQRSSSYIYVLQA